MAAAQARLLAAQELILTMRSKIAELKTYKVEPKAVKVLHAAFILLGERRRNLEDWPDVRKKLGAEFFESITGFQADQATKKILKRVAAAEELITGLDHDAVAASSEALAGISQWVRAAIETIQSAAAVALAQKTLAEKEAGDDTLPEDAAAAAAAGDEEAEDSQEDDAVLEEQAQSLVDAIVRRQQWPTLSGKNMQLGKQIAEELPFDGAVQTSLKKLEPAPES